ncbi:MAG: hypothetical protein QF475_01570 [Candidatus Undinarchaeales archaeon]|jgi:hypothetical protein|nr:hypothetical protein [Candidatus Undinarchaeales archaeon]
MTDKIRWIGVTILLVVMLIGSVSFMSNGVAPTGLISFNELVSRVTGDIVGLPDCMASMQFSIPETSTIYPSTITDVEVKVSDVRCGVNHAVLTLPDIDESLYTVSPAVHNSLYPKREYVYTVSFDIPEELAGKVYSTQALITGDGMLFKSEYFEIRTEAMPSKPAKTISPDIIENIDSESKGILDVFLSKNAWWGISIVAVLAAIALVIYEFSPVGKKGKK